MRRPTHPAKVWQLIGLVPGLVLGGLALGMASGGLAGRAVAAPPRPAKPAPAPPPLAPAPPPVRYLALGDSYTIGERVAPAARWPVQLAALLRARGWNVGEPEIVARTGWTVEDLAAALEESEPSGPYDLVSLQIGVNDEYLGREAEVYRGELRVMLRRAAAYAGGRPGRVIVLSIPDWSVTPFAARRSRSGADSGTGASPGGGSAAEIEREVERYNAVCREEASRAGARWVDVTPESRDAGKDLSLLADDGLHPAPAMYAAWAKLALESALAALGPPPVAPKPPPAPRPAGTSAPSLRLAQGARARFRPQWAWTSNMPSARLPWPRSSSPPPPSRRVRSSRFT